MSRRPMGRPNASDDGGWHFVPSTGLLPLNTVARLRRVVIGEAPDCAAPKELSVRGLFIRVYPRLFV